MNREPIDQSTPLVPQMEKLADDTAIGIVQHCRGVNVLTADVNEIAGYVWKAISQALEEKDAQRESTRGEADLRESRDELADAVPGPMEVSGVVPGVGWRLLTEGEPLLEGDGFLHPEHEGVWLDYACRPDIFRGNNVLGCPKKDYAHTWPWRRRSVPSVEPQVTKSDDGSGVPQNPSPTPSASAAVEQETATVKSALREILKASRAGIDNGDCLFCGSVNDIAYDALWDLKEKEPSDRNVLNLQMAWKVEGQWVIEPSGFAYHCETERAALDIVYGSGHPNSKGINASLSSRPRIHNKKLLSAIHAVIIEHSGNGELADYVVEYISASPSSPLPEGN